MLKYRMSFLSCLTQFSSHHERRPKGHHESDYVFSCFPSFGESNFKLVSYAAFCTFRTNLFLFFCLNITIRKCDTRQNDTQCLCWGWPEDWEQIYPKFGKSGPNNCQTKSAKIFSSKLNLKVQNISELLQYLQQMMLWNCLISWKCKICFRQK